MQPVQWGHILRIELVPPVFPHIGGELVEYLHPHNGSSLRWRPGPKAGPSPQTDRQGPASSWTFCYFCLEPLKALEAS